jgi:site-specific DNA recombinase
MRTADSKKIAMGTNSTTLRAVGYCRTSGEGQRDNTSIPTQRKCIEDFCDRNGWKFVTHYVDESKSGAKIAGRDSFQRMIKDAALEKFDVIVPFDVSRFARDGVDILGNAKFLKENFGVHLVDTKGSFDSRPGGNILLNYVNAGASEYERIKIMERMIGGRIQRARQGLPWSGKQPFGRTFDRKTGKWSINERGHRMRQLLERYANGEGLAKLIREFPEFTNARIVLAFANKSQLSGTYVKEFNIPELNIRGLKIPIPSIPAVISEKLMARVQARMDHRRTWNQEHRRSYVLTGFVRCGHCGKPLTGNTTGGRIYYRHCIYRAQSCVFHSMREKDLVQPVLDYLFRFFTDLPTLDEAVRRALPKDDERNEVQQERDRLKTNLTKIENKISRLIDAIAAGADVGMLIGKQSELKAEHEEAAERLKAVEAQLLLMPDRELLQHQIAAIQLQLLEKVQGRDWRKMPEDELRRFLIFLFGENPGKTGHGIHVKWLDGRWHIAFKGKVEFLHELTGGNAISRALKAEAAAYNQQAKRLLNQRVALTRQT